MLGGTAIEPGQASLLPGATTAVISYHPTDPWTQFSGQKPIPGVALYLQACWTCALHRVAAPWDSSALISALLPCQALLQCWHRPAEWCQAQAQVAPAGPVTPATPEAISTYARHASCI